MTQTRKKLVFSWVLILAMVISVISPGSTFVVKAAETDNISSLSEGYAEKLADVTKYLNRNIDEVKGSPYNYYSWIIMQQARSGSQEQKQYHEYYDSIVEDLKSKQLAVGDCATRTLALTAIGADADNIEGKSIITKMTNYDEVQYEYIDTIAAVLLALDSKPYVADNKEIRNKLVDNLVSSLPEDTGLYHYVYDYGDYGIWEGDSFDSTGAALQALAPYYNTNNSVKNLVDTALVTLSKRQNEDGSFGTGGDDPVSSSSQVLCALLALGIDPESDARFIKNGSSVVDAILSHYNSETGAIETGWEGYNPVLSSYQAGYALVAYDRFVKEAEALYDMSDVTTPIYHYGGKATCVKRAVCEVCGVEYGEVDPANHTGKTSLKNVKEATCTAVGYTGDKVCDDCGVIIEKGKETEKKAHTPVEIPAVAATETTTGKTAGKKCSVCGEILEAPKDVPATGVKETLSTDYKATSTDAANATVEYTAATDQGETSVTIQNVIKDSNGKEYAVTKVSDGAFANNKKLTDVTIGANVTEIGADAFKNCTKLSEVIIQDDSVTTIGAGAFSGAKALTEIDFSECKLQTIDQNAFSGCKKLKDIKLNGSKLTKVGKNAFKNVKKNAKFTIYAKNKKTYNKVVKLIKKSGAKKVKFAYKKKK